MLSKTKPFLSCTAFKSF